jgi:hypothetical protein
MLPNKGRRLIAARETSPDAQPGLKRLGAIE